jgi:hypothetical protein
MKTILVAEKTTEIISLPLSANTSGITNLTQPFQVSIFQIYKYK